MGAVAVKIGGREGERERGARVRERERERGREREREGGWGVRENVESIK